MSKRRLILFGFSLLAILLFVVFVMPPGVTKIVESQDIEPTVTPAERVTPVPGAEQPVVQDGPGLSDVTDLAPDVKLEDKATIIIKHSDGTKSGLIVTMDMINEQVNNIQEGDVLDNILPPQSMLGHRPPSLDDSTIPTGSSSAESIEFPPTPKSP